MAEEVLEPDQETADAALAACWLLEEEDRPGRFLGYGTLAEHSIVVLHPPRHPSPPQAQEDDHLPTAARVRTQVGHQVLDGALTSSAVPEAADLKAVILDGAMDAEPIDLPWPRPNDPTSLMIFNQALAELAESDPRQPPSNRPIYADPPGTITPTNEGILPPWCYIFPNCRGCHH